MTNETTFDNFAEKKLRKIFKDGSPIVMQVCDIETDQLLETRYGVSEADQLLYPASSTLNPSKKGCSPWREEINWADSGK